MLLRVQVDENSQSSGSVMIMMITCFDMRVLTIQQSQSIVN